VELNDLFQLAVDAHASDILLVTGAPPVLRVQGALQPTDLDVLTPQEAERVIRNSLNEPQLETLQKRGDLDYSIGVPGLGRFRINAHVQRSTWAAAVRYIPDTIPTLDELGIPDRVADFARLRRGLVLVTGPTGSGKSTTLAALIDLVNQERACHIITLEDPIEFLFHHGKSIVEQRQIGSDSPDFATALRHVVRQDPDVILVGEMRDLETMGAAISAAETGHLVFATLHTLSASQTLERIVDVFPATRQNQIRAQLAATLQGVVSQTLIPRLDGIGMLPAVEIMLCISSIRRCIREGETHLLPGIIETNRKVGMRSLDQAITMLYREGKIDREAAVGGAASPEVLEAQLVG